MTHFSDHDLKTILQAIPNNIPDEGKFFADTRFFPGIVRYSASNEIFQPQKSLRAYEQILSQIKRIDPERYERMHKGTPFYIMGCLAYEMEDYERGVFYMDAALSEDIHNTGPQWKTLPAASFLFLDVTNLSAAANEITHRARNEVVYQLERFVQTSGQPLDADTLVDQFFKPNVTDSSYRSILTAILTFLLEGRSLRLNLELRSHYGGTLEPFLTHLFKGGLIFESLLKRKYGTNGRHTLGDYLTAAKTDLQLDLQVYKRKVPYQFEELPSLLNEWTSRDFQEKAIATAFAVRNTAGHDLAWQDKFTDEFYLGLFEGIVGAIFWTIKKTYRI
jgi:hypothetical protein